MSTVTAALHHATTQTVCHGLDEAVCVVDLTQKDGRTIGPESDTSNSNAKAVLETILCLLVL